MILVLGLGMTGMRVLMWVWVGEGLDDRRNIEE